MTGKGYAKRLLGSYGNSWVVFECGRRVAIVTIRRAWLSEQRRILNQMGYRVKSGYTEVKGQLLRELLSREIVK